MAADGHYVLIDWRQDFAGQAEAADRYYDLAKFYHTLNLSVAAMPQGQYVTDQVSGGVMINHEDTPRQADAREAFWRFAAFHDYDKRRIEILNGLIFINMAPLYAKPLAQYLYYLGRLRLQQALGRLRSESEFGYILHALLL